MRNDMRSGWVKRNKWIFVVGPLALAAFVALFGEVVMLLWNWLAPALFGLHAITFWQALGLLVLCRILFGGFGGHGGGGSKRRKMAEHWETLTPEEREKLRQNWRGRCGGFGAPEGGSKEPA
jgi:hypothetical protein